MNAPVLAGVDVGTARRRSHMAEAPIDLPLCQLRASDGRTARALCHVRPAASAEHPRSSGRSESESLPNPHWQLVSKLGARGRGRSWMPGPGPRAPGRASASGWRRGQEVPCDHAGGPAIGEVVLRQPGCQCARRLGLPVRHRAVGGPATWARARDPGPQEAAGMGKPRGYQDRGGPQGARPNFFLIRVGPPGTWRCK